MFKSTRAQQKRSTPRLTRTQQNWLIAYLLLLPALAGLVVFRIYPIGLAIWRSLYTTTFGIDARLLFVGLENYQYIFSDPVFWQSLRVTLIFNVIVNPLQIGLALMLAMLANQRIRGIGLYRTIFFIPIGVSLPIAVIIWRMILDPNSGLANGILVQLGLSPQPFFTSPHQALWSIILLASWKGVSYWMLFILAGLQNIPTELKEAAMLDGASSTQRFFHVTLPLLKPVLLFVLVVDTSVNFLLFVPVYLLTGGGPSLSTNVLMYEAFKTGFVYTDLGSSLAMVLVLLVVIMGVVALQFRLLQAGRR